MTAPERLRRLAAAGVRVELAGDTLRLDAPAGALSRGDVESLRAEKPALLASIANADAALAEALSLLDRMEGAVRFWGAPVARQQARLAVLEVYRDVVTGYRLSFDGLLFESAEAVLALAARWRLPVERGGVGPPRSRLDVTAAS